MRIHRLELQAFGPFAGRETVDFSVLNDAGLFLLDGPTGAGKSTVLAGICFALYGSVPGDRTAESLASTQAPLGTRPEVLLDFTVGGRRFEALRWPKYQRPAKRKPKGGSALTDEKAGAVLREHRDGSWHEVSVRADEIGQLLRQVLYLDADQFMRVVLLPQGEFATFLRARSAEKETLLRKLFGTGRYDDVETYLKERHATLGLAVSRDQDLVAASRADLTSCLQDGLGDRWWCTDPDSDPDSDPDPLEGDRSVASAADAGSGDVDGPDSWPDADLVARATGAVAHAVTDSRACRQRAAEALASAQHRLEALTGQRQDLQAVLAWQERSARHESLREQVGADRRALELHRSAVPLDRRAREAEEAAGLHRTSSAALQEARRAALDNARCRLWAGAHGAQDAIGDGAGGSPEGSAEDSVGTAGGPRFEDLRQRADGELHRLADREQDAARLVATEAETERLRQSIDTLTEAATTAESERTALTEAHRDLRQRVEDLGAPAAGLDAARTAADESSARHRAAMRHRDHRTALLAAEDALRTATDHAQRGTDAWHEIVEKRLAGAASLLAAQLRPEEPCQVCGSVDHPAPAGTGGAEISAEAQERARQEMADLTARRQDAQAAVDRARQTADASRLAAGGLSPEEAEAAAERARTMLTEAERATRDLAAARAALEQNEKDQQARAVAAEAARGDLAVAQSRLAAAADEGERLRAVLAEALGGREDLAVLRRELEDARALVDAVLDAARDESTRRSLARQATDSLAGELEASGFGTVEAVRAALLDEDGARLRGTRVTDWDHEGAALDELEASAAVVRGRDLLAEGTAAPSDEDLERCTDELAVATRTREEAAERAGGLESLQKQVRRQARVLEDVAGRSAGQLAELQEAEGLLRLVRGAGENSLRMTLGSYVLAGRLEEVVASATERLLGMTQGRYELRHDDTAGGRGVRGLDITVFDRYTEDERPAGTLSGGETFMASLALALGLADTVQAEAGGVDMDTLFVDEGFGSLDSSSLADVMEVLDGLQADGRAIGVVSHVDRMKQDIGYRLEVVKTRQGSHLRAVVPDAG